LVVFRVLFLICLFHGVESMVLSGVVRLYSFG